MDENLLALMYDDGEIDGKEFLVLHQANPQKMCTTDFRTGNMKGFISRQYERTNTISINKMYNDLVLP